MECEVPVEHGMNREAPDIDVVEVPVGLLFECERLMSALREQLGGTGATADTFGDEQVVEELNRRWQEDEEGDDFCVQEPDEAHTPLTLHLPWLDLAALAQLTYWYDRRPQGEELATAAAEAQNTAMAIQQEERMVDAKFGRWTKKISREKVVYGTVALRYRTRGHLGQQVFRRPAGIDVTRLSTLRRAAALCGHGDLLTLVEQTMEQLHPKNVSKIPWAEAKKHVAKDDLWLLIDGRIYDVTPFLDLHPGGGQLIVEAAGKDATSVFERTHGEGLRYSLRLLNQFFIGDCVGAEEAEPMEDAQPTPEFLQTLRSITGALHTFDEAKATGEFQGLK